MRAQYISLYRRRRYWPAIVAESMAEIERIAQKVLLLKLTDAVLRIRYSGLH